MLVDKYNIYMNMVHLFIYIYFSNDHIIHDRFMVQGRYVAVTYLIFEIGIVIKSPVLSGNSPYNVKCLKELTTKLYNIYIYTVFVKITMIKM